MRPREARAPPADVAAHLEVVEQFGIHMQSFERSGRMQVCYDGELFHRVLTLAGASAEERAHAALGLDAPGLHRSGAGARAARRARR